MNRYNLSPFGKPNQCLFAFGLSPVFCLFPDATRISWTVADRTLPILFPTPLIAETATSSSPSGLILGIAGLVAGAVITAIVQKMLGQDARTQSVRLLEQAKSDAENLIKKSELEQKEKLLQLQSQFEQDLKKQR